MLACTFPGIPYRDFGEIGDRVFTDKMHDGSQVDGANQEGVKWLFLAGGALAVCTVQDDAHAAFSMGYQVVHGICIL